MTTSLLSLANGALRLLRSSRPLTQAEYNNGTRGEARAVKAAIDGGALRYCLEEGTWKFAKRSAQIDATPSIEPDFGFTYAFEHPTDYVRTIGCFSDEAMKAGMGYHDIRDEAGHWWANIETIYVSYVSDDEQYGMDFSLWPQSFVKFVEAHLASEIAGPMTGEGQEMLKLRKRLRSEALNKDAMRDPSPPLAAGAWVQARHGGGRGRENG